MTMLYKKENMSTRNGILNIPWFEHFFFLRLENILYLNIWEYRTGETYNPKPVLTAR